MLRLDDGPIEVRLLTPGVNWLKVGSMMALGLSGYFSPLPEGSTVMERCPAVSFQMS